MTETRIYGPCLADLKAYGEKNFKRVGPCVDCPHSQMARKFGLMLAGYGGNNNSADHDMSEVIEKMRSTSKTMKLADLGTRGCVRRLPPK